MRRHRRCASPRAVPGQARRKLGSDIVAWSPSYSSLGSLPSTDAQVVKVLQTELKVGVVVRDARTRVITAHVSELPVHLQSIERTTAECIHAACLDALRMTGLSSSFEDQFVHSVAVVTQYMASSNQREQRAAKTQDKAGSCAVLFSLPCSSRPNRTSANI